MVQGRSEKTHLVLDRADSVDIYPLVAWLARMWEGSGLRSSELTLLSCLFQCRPPEQNPRNERHTAFPMSVLWSRSEHRMFLG